MREPFMNLSQRIAIAFTLFMTVAAPASLANEALEAEVKVDAQAVRNAAQGLMA